ncbi:MAG: PAS domain-containing protein, partial [Proteobacteria bacterium]
MKNLSIPPSADAVIPEGGIDPFGWLVRKGEMAQRMRTFDWASTELGAPASWPAGLKASVNLCLASGYPMYVWWGPSLINIYNDAYVPIAGPLKHPRCFGRPAEETWPEIWPVLEGFVDEVRRTGQSVWREELLMPVQRNGHREDAYFTFSFNPVPGDDGSFQGVACICHEVTSRILAERNLKVAHFETELARKELHSFLMQAPIGIAILSGSQHEYTFLNPRFVSLLFAGRPAEEFLHRTVREVFPEMKGQGFFEILDDVYRTGRPFIGAKVAASIKQADGVERSMYINFTYQARRDTHGRIDGILAVIYEVTDQVNEQKEFELLASNLRSALVARDEFLGVASHELNTPLTSLKLQMQIAKRLYDRQGRDGLSEERLHKLINGTLFQLDRLGHLVGDMLDVSRINSGKLSMNLVYSDISALVAETLERLHGQIDAGGGGLHLSLAPGLHT